MTAATAFSFNKAPSAKPSTPSGNRSNICLINSSPLGSDRSAPSDLIKSLGADLSLPRGEEFIKHILERFPEGVDGLADGALLNEKAVAAVKNGGSFTAVRGYQGTAERDINFTQTWVRTQDCMYEKLDDLRKLVNANKVSLRLADRFSPSQVSEAHKRFESRGVIGRLVIKFN